MGRPSLWDDRARRRGATGRDTRSHSAVYVVPL